MTGQVDFEAFTRPFASQLGLVLQNPEDQDYLQSVVADDIAFAPGEPQSDTTARRAGYPGTSLYLFASENCRCSGGQQSAWLSSGAGTEATNPDSDEPFRSS